MDSKNEFEDTKPAVFPYSFEGQKDDAIGAACGACDIERRTEGDVLQTRRFSVGCVRFVNASGELTASPQTIKLFSKGVGEAGSDAQVDGNLTDADTDALSDGALCAAGDEHFRALALHLTFGSPFVRDTTGEDRESRAWMDDYRAEMQRRVADDLFVSIEHGESKLPYKLGVVGMYPAQSGLASSDGFAQIGAPLAGAAIPFRTVLKGGAKSTSARLRVLLTLPNGRKITLAARGVPADADTVLLVRGELLGYVARGSVEGFSSEVNATDRAMMRAIAERQNRSDAILGRIAEKLGL